MGVLDQVCLVLLMSVPIRGITMLTLYSGPIGGVSLLVFLLAWPKKEHLPSLERRAWKDVDFVGAFLL